MLSQMSYQPLAWEEGVLATYDLHVLIIPWLEHGKVRFSLIKKTQFQNCQMSDVPLPQSNHWSLSNLSLFPSRSQSWNILKHLKNERYLEEKKSVCVCVCVCVCVGGVKHIYSGTTGER